jgi:membrane-associated phospholipid phosphatase
MLSSLIFYGFLFLALIVLPAGLILVVLLFLEHRRQLWQGLAPVSHIIGRQWSQRSFARDLGTRFPRTAQFATRRLDADSPWGLSWTLAGIGILAGLWFFLGVMEDLTAKDPLVVLDIRLHNVVALFRTPALTRIMLSLTELGSSTVLALLCGGIILLALAAQRPRLAATVLLAPLLAGLMAVILKALFSYARPIDAIVTAHEASFPSGHMLGGAVVYGLLAALLLASRVQRGLRALGVVALLLLIVGIGLSRLYLGVHWPSDLLGSLALALMLLASLLFFLHYRSSIAWLDNLRLPTRGAPGLRAAGVALVLVAIGAAGVMAGRTTLIAARPAPVAHPVTLQSLQMALPTGLPRWSEDLIGGQMEPVSLLLVGSEEDIAAAFRRTGWMLADPPTPVRVLQEAIAAIQNQPDPTGPATPAFYADRPQNLTFEKPDAGAPSIRRRHHTRLWKTAYCLLPGCRPLWVATASFDIGVEISRQHIPTHRIDTAIDDERAVIVADLTAAGASRVASVAVSQATHGTNAAGDPFTTDGLAVLLVLP